MLLALVIPRPQGEYTLTGIIDKIDAKARKASQFAVLPGDRAEGEGAGRGEQDPKAKQPGDGQPRKPTEKGDPSGKPQDNAQQGKQNSGDGQSDRQSQSKQSGDDKNGSQQGQSSNKSGDKSAKSDSRSKDSQNADAQQKEKGNNSEDKGQNQKDQNGDKQKVDPNSKPNQPDANKTPPPTPTTASATSITRMLAPFVRWILYGLLAIVGLYFLIRYWSRFVEFLAKLWAELLSLFAFLQAETERKGWDDKQEPAPRVQSAFRFLRGNPYYSGAADRMTPPQLIRYTFEALEAWSREQSVERAPEQTPLEFAQELGERVPALAKDVIQTAQLYAHIAYARKVPSRERLEALERLWRRLVF